MPTIVRIGIIFLGVSLLAPMAMTLMGAEFGTVSYWKIHGIFLLIFLSFFPRLTLLLSSIPFGGFFWWLGWFFAPRVLVATLATLAYWNTNPILVTCSWLIAWGGESTEKYVINVRRRRYYNHTPNEQVIDV